MEKHFGRTAVIGAALLLASCIVFAAEAKKRGGDATLAAAKEEIVRYVRERFSVPQSTKLTVEPFQDSEFRDFYKTKILVDNGKQKSTQKAFVTKDGRYLIFGNIYTLGGDPRQEVERQINLTNQSGVGPASAPVTIVEYADLECPTCARMHQFLAHDLIPKYGNKVRVVFKEFPLYQIHPWALTGAIADQCAYEIDPSLYYKYRSMIFDNQNSINATNVRSMLLDYGQTVGLDRLKLATCIDSKASLPRVEASLREGQALGVSETPSLFVNGKLVVGAPPPAEFYKIVDDALKSAH
jgi:protein-disulfide isomerase